MPYKDKSRYQSEEYKEHQRNYQREWHQRNKERRLARMYEQKAARRAAIRDYIQNIKSQFCCVDCGQQHPATLHFHHQNSEDKAFTIGEAIDKGFSLDRIKAEIEKCIILCANCHFKRHYNMRHKEHISPGIAGELEELNTILAISSDEEDAYNMAFGNS